MWPFAPASPLRPEPPRISREHPDYHCMWMIHDRDVARVTAARERAWARWNRQWATANAVTLMGFLFHLLWMQARSCNPLPWWGIALAIVFVSFLFAWFECDCITKARERDAAAAEADQAAEEFHALIDEAGATSTTSDP